MNELKEQAASVLPNSKTYVHEHEWLEEVRLVPGVLEGYYHKMGLATCECGATKRIPLPFGDWGLFVKTDGGELMKVMW